MRAARWFLALGLAGCGTSTPPAAPPAGAAAPFEQARGERYLIEAGASHATAKVGVAGMLSSFGHEHLMAIRDLSGEARMGPKGVEGGTVEIVIRADSLAETGKGFSVEERRKIDRDVQEQALETHKYPQILLQGTLVSARPVGPDRVDAQLEGRLTLHGVTRPLSLPVELTLLGDSLRARGEFGVRHADFGLRLLTAAGGAVRPSERIAVAFDLLARRHVTK